MRRYIGTSSIRRETISATPIRLMAATLDLPGVDPEPDDAVPPLWHWLYFLPDNRLSDLDDDGHPKRGEFFPDCLPRRRMFGGASLTFHQALRIGETVECRTEIVGAEEREGNSGPLVLLRLLRQLEGESGPAITEHQTLIYTDSPPVHHEGELFEAPEAAWQQDIIPDSRLLFRFSALTFNTHRIHYDLRFATEVEGYPNLVVQGPLTALLLAEMARRRGVALEEFVFRARAPFFVGDVMHLRGTPTPHGVELTAHRGAVPAMQATARAGTSGVT